MTATTGGPVITKWAAVSPFGLDRKDFLDGVSIGRPAPGTTAEVDGVVPGERGYVVPGFDIRTVLGRKGTRGMDRVTALAVSAVGQLLGAAGTGSAPAGTALVLGTTGSAQSMMDFTRSSLLGDRPYHVDPVRMPNTVMNCAAGRCAIWYGLTGPNTTLAGGRPSGLIALRYASRLLTGGRASAVLIGAAEESSTDRAWLDFHSREPGDAAAPLGEGAGMLLLEPAGSVGPDRVPLAEVLSVRSRVYPDGDLRDALRDCVRHALGDAGVDPAEVSALAPSGAGGRPGAQEAEVLDGLLGDAARRFGLGGLLGDTGAASAALHLAAAVGTSREQPGIALITSVDVDGTVACAVLRTFEDPR